VFTRPGLLSQYTLDPVSTPSFSWVSSYAQQTSDLTIAYDASGDLWTEDVVNAAGTLTKLSQTVLPGDSPFGVTAFQRKYISFNNHDITRQFDGTNWDKVSQEGPAAPARMAPATIANPNLANITSYSVASDVVTFSAANGFSTNELVQVTGTGTVFDGVILTVASASGSQFTANFNTANVASTTISGVSTPVTGFPISTITQPGTNTAGVNWGSFLWSAGPGQQSAGNVITIYYGPGQSGNDPDQTLISLFQSGVDVYVYIHFGGITGWVDGTYKVTSVGHGLPVQGSQPNYYFTVQAPSINYLKHGSDGSSVTYQITMATVTVSTPIPGVAVGGQVAITGVTTETSWNNTWTVVKTPNGGVLNVTATQLTSGTATYTYTLQSGSDPVAGDLVTVIGCVGVNAQGQAIFNQNNATVATANSTTFTITGFSGDNVGPFVETGQAQTVGTTFLIDPGPQYVNNSNQSSPIFGNASDGTVVYTNTALSVAPGTRQAVVMFLTRNGYLTKASPAFTFTVPNNTTNIQLSNIPIGPPNVIARWIAFTEAGANGVPGAYFYVIPQAVPTIVGGLPFIYQPTVINDNTSTSGTFYFTDAVLLSALEIDITGGNQFNVMDLSSAQWCINYANRMFYGLVDNKVNNFLNMSFNGGYTNLSEPYPLGWVQDASTNGQNGSLVASEVFGNAYYILNNTGSTQSVLGMILQGAYQDSYNVPIIQPNTTYSARVTASIPSGLTAGNLVLELIPYNGSSNTYGISVGNFTIPFSSLSTTPSVQIGTLLTTALTTIDPTLVLRLYATSIHDSNDVQVQRIEIFSTMAPVLNTSLLGSYVNAPEAVDAVTGILGVAGTNTQSLNGGFVMYDQLYLLKTSSMFSTQDTPNAEPSGWAVHEVSNTVGACGPYAYDVGEEWAVMACRQGIYVFFGKQPIKISQEIFQLWELINWKYANTIWVKNDIVNRRILIGVPMATPNAYLPNAGIVTNPTSPNVIIALNYLGLGDITALAEGEQMRTTMFGTLMSVDMRRKWTIWQVSSPFANFIQRGDLYTNTLFLCNANGSTNIDAFTTGQLSDNGVAINGLYTTYGWVDMNKQQQNPLLGMHRKMWTYLQMLASGSGTFQVSALLNNLNPQLPFHIQNLPGIKLSTTPSDDYERSLNAAGNRVFLQFSTNAVGAAFNLERVILVGGIATLPIRGNAAQ
jgi:hypothetical protein